jgi:hypothetical protein
VESGPPVPTPRLAVASTARMMATGAILVVIGAFITAKHTSILLDGFVYIHDADAVATCALDHFNCYAHCISPFFTGRSGNVDASERYGTDEQAG